MRTFKIDWLKTSDDLRLSEHTGGEGTYYWGKVIESNRSVVARWLLANVTGKISMAERYGDRFEKKLSGKEFYPMFMSENDINDWIKDQISAEI